LKLLIVGSVGTHFLTELAQRLESDDNEVYILDFTTLQLTHKKQTDEIYANLLKHYSRIKFVDRIVRPLLINKILQKYDFDMVNFQFLYWHYIFCIRTFFKIKTKVFFTIFGSDFYRAGVIKRHGIYPEILKQSSGIIFTNEKTKEDFQHMYQQLKKIKKYVCRLGLPALEYIDRNRKNKESIYTYFSLPREKTIVTVGYNLTKEQQHIKAIDAIECLKSEQKARLHVLFPLTYGGNSAYLQEIQTYLRNNAIFSYTIFTAYMGHDEISKLRLVSDVMINILKTDQFSGSMQEHLYANSVVIAGNWLPYETMLDTGIYMQGIDSVEELPEVLSEVLEHMDIFKQRCKNNAKYVAQLSSWGSVISCWKDIFR